MNKLTITETDTVADVCRKLRAVLDEEKLIDEYFSVSGMAEQPFWKLVESHRWIACYAVTGGSEGHYIHIDLIHGYDHDWSGRVVHLITGKTFLGLAHALRIANRCAELPACLGHHVQPRQWRSNHDRCRCVSSLAGLQRGHHRPVT